MEKPFPPRLRHQTNARCEGQHTSTGGYPALGDAQCGERLARAAGHHELSPVMDAEARNDIPDSFRLQGPRVADGAFGGLLRDRVGFSAA